MHHPFFHAATRIDCLGARIIDTDRKPRLSIAARAEGRQQAERPNVSDYGKKG
jgi:hypothetical protein